MEAVLKTIETFQVLNSTIEALEILKPKPEKETRYAQKLRVMDGKGYLCFGKKSLLEITFVPYHSACLKLTWIVKNTLKKTLTRYIHA